MITLISVMSKELTIKFDTPRHGDADFCYIWAFNGIT